MNRTEIMAQIVGILEDVAEISPDEVNEDSVLMDDLDLSSMEILTSWPTWRRPSAPASPRRSCAALSPSAT